ncbi:hypothetical protein SOMG_04949 [Schizosaccharomyces osmophilus]|uniref:Uncharacterized protein n=1 Tax=Schizosaccharomyces osmophilus TaxID=2545709 RepID=A0AAE9WIX6_9SCHI|nr:uncharacterized protein SOMG_04949 [Schizosaccharomyces osmophilus]WBW75008.1 hypothetical protein SOMG_04949 [Schizosaccharomyces osmophilus]
MPLGTSTNEKDDLNSLLNISVTLYSIYCFILFIIYLVNFFSSEYSKFGEECVSGQFGQMRYIHTACGKSERKNIENIASVFTFFPCLILGIICTILFSIYNRPIVVRIEDNAIPLEDISRKSGKTNIQSN